MFLGYFLVYVSVMIIALFASLIEIFIRKNNPFLNPWQTIGGRIAFPMFGILVVYWVFFMFYTGIHIILG